MAGQKTEQQKELELAHKVRDIHARLLRGVGGERDNAHQLLEELLTRNRMTLGDVARLIALVYEDEKKKKSETTANDNTTEDEPASSDVNVFDAVEWMLRRFLVLEDHQFTALTLWVLHTFVFRDFQHSPRLALLSPTRGCGKSTVLNLCLRLCLLARKFDSTSTASLPRLIDRDQPTVLLDEADNMDFAHEPVLRQILNAGYEEGGVREIVVRGEARDFRLFAPVAFAAIGQLPSTLMSRSIVINMHRAPPSAKIERFDSKDQTLKSELDAVYRLVHAWSLQVRGKLDTNPAMPDRFYGRLADRWRALISIADALEYSNKARKAAKAFAAEHQDEDIKVTLLSDIRRVFGAFADDRIKTSLLLQHLLALDDAPWNEFCGIKGNRNPKRLTESEIHALLRAFGIPIKTIWPRPRRPDSKSSRGYYAKDFEQAWASYCDAGNPPPQPSIVRHLGKK